MLQRSNQSVPVTRYTRLLPFSRLHGRVLSMFPVGLCDERLLTRYLLLRHCHSYAVTVRWSEHRYCYTFYPGTDTDETCTWFYIIEGGGFDAAFLTFHPLHIFSLLRRPVLTNCLSFRSYVVAAGGRKGGGICFAACRVRMSFPFFFFWFFFTRDRTQRRTKLI